MKTCESFSVNPKYTQYYENYEPNYIYNLNHMLEMNLNMEDNEPVTKKLKCSDNSQKEFSGIVSTDHEHQNSSSQESPNSLVKTSDLMHLKEQKDNENPMDSNDEVDSICNDEDASFTFPPDENISDMLEGVEYSGTFPTVTDRYLTPYYKVDVQKPRDDICIWMHSNRICMISLAPSHFLLQEDTKIAKVNFKISDKLDRASNKVSGKSKHGAQPLQTNSNICTILCTDGQTHTVKCCMIGKLVEVNEALLDNPELVKQPPHKGGYLAIVLPNIKLLDKMKETLLSKQQYESFMLTKD